MGRSVRRLLEEITENVHMCIRQGLRITQLPGIYLKSLRQSHDEDKSVG